MKISPIAFSIVFALLLLVNAVPVHAATTCTFTRDLILDVEGEDVRCLQKYLNASGFTVALSGVGSAGHETTQYRDLTKKAVMAWQKVNGISPTTGYFGVLSRAKYNTLVSGISTTPSTTTSADAQIASLMAQIQAASSATKPTTPAPSTTSNSSALDSIKKTIALIKKAEDQVDDEGDDTGYAEKELNDAKDNLFKAVDYYFRNNLADAKTYADRAYGKANDAFEDAGGETDDDKAENYVDGIQDKLDDAHDTVDDSDSKNRKAADSKLDAADDYIDDAYDAIDDEEPEDARAYAKKALNALNDALDLLDESGDKGDAKDAINDAQDAIDDAQDAIDDADDDGKDVDDAQNMLDDAESKLNKAEDYYDDENYDKALDYARDAEDLADEARDEI